MNWGALRDELNNDPLGRGYSTMSDAQAADDLNTAYRLIVVTLHATAKTLMASMDPGVAAGILDKLEAAGGNNSVVKWTMKFLTNSGIDLGHPNTRAQIQGLADAGVLLQGEADSLIGMADRDITRAAELNLLGRSPEVGPAHVARARN